MATLYELTDEYRQLLEMLEDPDEDPEVIRDTMEGISGELEDKAEGYGRVIRQLAAESAALKEEEERLAKKRKAADGAAKRLKEALFIAMKETGKTKFKTPLFSFTIQKNPPSVKIPEDLKKIPTQYHVSVPDKIDKKMILKDAQAGIDVSAFAEIIQTEGVRIR